MIFLIPLIVYLFSYQGDYIFSDDYWLLWKSDESPDVSITTFLSQGRPLAGLIIIGVFEFIDFSKIWIFHILSTVFFVLASISLVSVMNKLNKNRAENYMIGFASMAVTPGIQVLIGWGSTFVFIAAMILTNIGVKLIADGCERRYQPVGYILLATSMFVYQPTTAWGVALLGAYSIWLLKNGRNFSEVSSEMRLKFGMTILLLSALINISLILRYKVSATNIPRGQILGDLQEKIDWVTNSGLQRMFALVAPWKDTPGTSLFFAFSAICFLIGLYWKNLIFVAFTLLVLLGVSISPLILTADNYASNRSFFPAQLLIVLFMIWSLAEIFKHKKIFVQVIYVSVMFYSAITVHTNWTNPQVFEKGKIEIELTYEKCSKLRYVIPSSLGNSLVGRWSMDEFGIPSTSQTWVPIPLTELICKGVGYEPEDLVLILNDKPIDATELNTLDLPSLLRN